MCRCGLLRAWHFTQPTASVTDGLAASKPDWPATAFQSTWAVCEAWMPGWMPTARVHVTGQWCSAACDAVSMADAMLYIF